MRDLDRTEENRLFTTNFMNSVNKIKKLGMSSSLANTAYGPPTRTITDSMSMNMNQRRPLEEMPLIELVQKFLEKDSEYQISPDQIADSKEESKRSKMDEKVKFGAYPKP